MKTFLYKSAAAVLLAGAASYCGVLAAPLCILLLVMLTDYLTGLIKAWMRSDLSSRTGVRGILKKVCYMAMVAVGAVVDYLLESALQVAGIDGGLPMFCGMLVTVWLIVNELISILENLDAIGVPGFPALNGVLNRLRSAVSRAAEEPNEEP